MIDIPTPVWEQLGVVVIFAAIAGYGLNWIMNKFTAAISDINSHYGRIIADMTNSWQKYFDARMEATKMVNDETVKQLNELTKAVSALRRDFDSHDQWERQVQENMPPVVERPLPRTGKSR